MTRENDKLTVIFQKGNKKMVVKSPLNGNRQVVVVLNSQFTNAPNTTQLASGAGRSSAAGNNASIDSTNSQQQQAVGAGGKAKNRGMKGKQVAPIQRNGRRNGESGQKKAVVIVNDQVVKLARRGSNASATQVAAGGGTDSTGGTNSAIESLNSKQQHAVGGGKGSVAFNKSAKSNQKVRASKKGKANGKARAKTGAKAKRKGLRKKR